MDFWISCPLSQHKHHIQIILPSQPPPPQGYQALYMLDGDWLTKALLHAVQAVQCPVAVIAIGYGPDRDISRAARAYDYTPALTGQPEYDPRNPQWRSGGAGHFLSFLESVLMPAVESRIPADPTQRTLYGHSYGGLFVLHALYQRPELYQRYIAASPSLWWRDQYLITAAKALCNTPPCHPTELLLMLGGQETWHPLPAGTDHTDPDRRHGMPTLPLAKLLLQYLNTVPQLVSTLELSADLNHAQMLLVSALRAVALATHYPRSA